MFEIYSYILNSLCEIKTAARKSNKNLLKSHWQFANQPCSQGSLLPIPTQQERERPWLGLVLCGCGTKLILGEESFVSQFYVLFTQ